MSSSVADLASTIVVVESPNGLEIRLRELRFQPIACVQLLLGAVLLAVAATVVAFWMEDHWPRAWTRSGVWIASGAAVGLGMLVPLLYLMHRWHQVMTVDQTCVALHCHESWDQHYSRTVRLTSIRSIHAKPVLTIVDPLGEPWLPLSQYTEAEQQRVYRLIVDCLRRIEAIPSLHEIDEWETRVETLQKPAESKLYAEGGKERFRVEIPLPPLLPNERNLRSCRNSLIVVGVAVGIAAVALSASALTNLPHPLSLVPLCILVGFLALGSTVSSRLARKQADEATRALTQAISVVGDLLVRTTGMGDKQVWRRGEIRDIDVVVALGTGDSEGNSTPDTVALSVVTRQGRKDHLHFTTFDRGRNETPRAEVEWIASQLRLALKLYAPPPPAAPALAAEVPAPSSTAIIANQRDVQP